MALSVNGKSAIVTGAGSGICLAFTKKLLENGCNVVLADLKLLPEAQAVVDGKGISGSGKAVFLETDVTDWSQLQACFDTAVKEFGSVDIVVPGAGVFEPGKGHGVILNISSIAAQMPLLPLPLYSCSKAAISQFVRCMGTLEATEGIRVVAVAPGIVKTPIWTEDKLAIVDESQDDWVPVDKVTQTMLDLIQTSGHPGGTIIEIGYETLRPVNVTGDPGPTGRGFQVSKIADAFAAVHGAIPLTFGK